MLTFAELRAANLARCRHWHQGGIEDWSFADWLLATVGELGEAANVAKKLKRIQDGIPGNKPGEDEATLRAALGKEIADVMIYLDLLAAREGIDLAAAVIAKFNATSERVGFPDRLPGKDEATGDLEDAIGRIPRELSFLIGRGRTRPDEPLYGAAIYRDGIYDLDQPIAEGESDESLADAVQRAVASLFYKREKGNG